VNIPKSGSFLSEKGRDQDQKAEKPRSNPETPNGSTFSYDTAPSGAAAIYAYTGGDSEPDAGLKSVQESLKNIGYLEGSPTGIYDQPTKDAIAAFQRDNGIAGDGGFIDTKTLELITYQAAEA
jgi:peptidoglycan hydrolase-like protein with peptidoglycan-binding domain